MAAGLPQGEMPLLPSPVDLPASRRAFLDQLVAYAGLFPPAELGVPEAFATYIAHRRGSDRWMLGAFLLPVGRLAEFDAALAETRGGAASAPWDVIVLPRGGADIARTLREDLAASDDFVATEPSQRRLVGLELKVPPAVLGDDGRLGAWCADLVGTLTDRHLPVFLEPPRDPQAGAAVQVAAALARVASRSTAPPSLPATTAPLWGLKLRCGGLEAAAVPTIDEVARFLRVAIDAQLSFKATAGLHHPLRHVDATLGVEVHGFVNVFVAALAAAQGVGEGALRALLAERVSAAFRWSDAALEVHGLRMATETIRSLRRGFVVGFGSCSFDEPCADLRALDWL